MKRLLALFAALAPPDRHHEWRAHRGFLDYGSKPHMRRWRDGKWERREMTPEELADFASQEAW